ncbi:MAG: DUF1028 domain-containing protein [Actinomycetota bacterium]
MTYSIVARDPDTGIIGLGLQSHFYGVGSIATFAEAGVGGICSQAFASRQYGPIGLDLLRAGGPAPDVLEALRRLDPHHAVRQVGLVDGEGRAAAFTGDRCAPHAGHCVGDGVTAQGNMLAAEVWEAMVAAYEKAAGTAGFDMADRIVAALEVAEDLGGDARGRQSVHLLVVGGQRTAAPWNSVLYDERVDDHPDPLGELRRLVTLRRAFSLVGAVLFDDGPLFQPLDRIDTGRVEELLAGLEQAETMTGDNREPSLWRGVLLARTGRVAEAAAVLVPVLAARPPVAGFLSGLEAIDVLPSGVAAQLVGSAVGEGR